MGNETGVMQETKRDRVRRLLIQPLTEDFGFRRPGNITAEKHDKNMIRLCDELSYLSDEGFARLRGAMRGKGDGKGRDAWPALARVISWAELIEPRPIETMPAMLRWFRSAAGPEARAAHRLVEEFEYWENNKHPPVVLGAKRQVMEWAEKNQRRAEVIEDQIRRGVDPGADEQGWLNFYRDREAWICQLIGGGT